MVSSWPGSTPFCRPKPGLHLHAGGVGQEPEEYIAPLAPVWGPLVSQRSPHRRGFQCRPSPGHTPAWWAPCVLESHQHPQFAAGARCAYCWVPKQRTISVPGAAEGGGVPRGNLSFSIWLAPLIPTLNVLFSHNRHPKSARLSETGTQRDNLRHPFSRLNRLLPPRSLTMVS